VDEQIALVACQPICDRSVRLAGYQVLFHPRPAVGARATGDAVPVEVQELLDLGLDNLSGSSRAWITLTRSALSTEEFRRLPANRVVLEVLEPAHADKEFVRHLRRAKAFGYVLAFDEHVLAPEADPLLSLATVLKVNVADRPDSEVSRLAKELAAPGRRLLADRVESYEAFDRAREAGFELFQGSFFTHPNPTQGRPLSSARVALLYLLTELQNPNTSMERIEVLVAADEALVAGVLRYVNSVALGVREKIQSLRHAIVMLGLDRLRGCVAVLLFAGMEDKPGQLVTTALVRARFCELLGIRIQGSPQEHFAAGLLSLLDAFLDQPLPTLVERMGLSDEVARALLRREGSMGECIDLCIASENADWFRISSRRWDLVTLRACYLEALTWAHQVQTSILPRAF